jgi:hypothetical protein
MAKRRLINLQIDEVSLVDKAATKRRFFFVKNAAGVTIQPIEKKAGDDESGDGFISIESDGTVAGTTLEINGEEITNVSELSLSFWSPDPNSKEICSCPPGTPGQVSFRYVVAGDKDDNGVVTTTTHQLRKSQDDLVAEADATAIKKYLGETADLSGLTAADGTALANDINVLADYSDVLPTAVRDVVIKSMALALRTRTPVVPREEIEKMDAKEAAEMVSKIVAETMAAQQAEAKKADEAAKATAEAAAKVAADAEAAVEARKTAEDAEAAKVAEEEAAAAEAADEVEVSPEDLAGLVADAVKDALK